MQSVLGSAVSKVLVDLIYAVAIALLAYGFPLLKRAGSVLMSKVPANYRTILQSLAHDAVVYVEQFITTGGGQAKFEAAVQRVIAALQAHGIDLSLAEIENAIQKAYQDALKAGEVSSSGKKATDPAPQPQPTPTPAPNPQPAPAPADNQQSAQK